MKLIVLLFTILLFPGFMVAGDSLKVISVLPAQQSISAEPSSIIEIDFNLRVDPTSFTDTSFMVWGRWSAVHTGVLAFNSIGTIAYFNPDEDFFYGEWITVSLSKGIKDEFGSNLSLGYAWNFWTITTTGSLDLTRTTTIEVRQPGEGWIQTYGTYAGDLNGDGWSDFVVPNERPNDVRVFMNDGFGNYTDFTIFSISGGNRPSTNEGMDYNLDGFIDIAVGSSQNNIVTVFLADGTGDFSSIQNYNASQGVRGLTIADAQGDGFADIITANRNASNVSVLVNNGDGTFADPFNFDGNVDGETACITADVNSDGIMDLFVAGIQSDDVALFLGDGNGSFIFSDKVSVGNGPWMITSGDINSDGIPDVATANADGATLSIVFANSDGTLSAAISYPTGSFPLAIDLGDIDGDGDLDVVTSNFSTADYTMYENDGTGNYINRRNLDANSAGSCAVLHDRDNDGDMDMTGIDEIDDLLILFTNDNAVSVDDENISPEMFSLSQNYPNPFNPTTTISYALPYQSSIELTIYDIMGREIKSFNISSQASGYQSIVWDGTNENRVSVSSGIYLYRISVKSLENKEVFVKTSKLMLLK